MAKPTKIITSATKPLIPGSARDAREQVVNIAKIFGISQNAFESLVEAQRDPASADPYRVLGIAADASEDQARAAWRQLVRDHHPDRLTGAGMPQEFVALANERLAAINVAWAALPRRKGWA